MKIPYVVISLATYEDTIPWSFGQRLLELLCSYPKLQPERIGYWDIDMEPFGSVDDMESRWVRRTINEYQGKKIEGLESHWWERKRVARSTVYFSHTFTNMKSTQMLGILNLHAHYHKSVDWRELFDNLCVLMKPKNGMLHIFTDDERPMGRGNQKFPMGSFDSPTRSGPYDFGWMYVSGHNCYDEVMAADLEGTDIIRVDHGSYATLQIAKGEDELFNDFKTFAARRELLKERLPIIISEEPVSIL